jgi:hypothetical protein
MKNISQEKVLGIRTIWPPHSAQSAFAGILAAIDRQAMLHEKSLAQLDGLFASLQHSAFRGEL